MVQIGTKHAHATGAIRTMRSLDAIYEIVAIAEPDDERRQKLANDPNYKDLYICGVEEALSIEGLDAAVIETEEKELTKYARLAAERGLHIQMDKPGGEDVLEFEHLIREVEKKQLIIQLGYMYRFNPAVKKAFELVEKGIIGEVFSVETHMSIDLGEKANNYISQFKGGMMYFLGCHLVDIVYRICGEPEKVIPQNCSIDGSDCLNFGMTTYQYKNGVSIVRTSSREINGFLRRQIVIIGTSGTIEISPIEVFVEENPDFLKTSLRLSVKDVSNSPNFDCSTIMEFPNYRRYDDMFIHFAELVNGLRQNAFTYEYELGLHRLLKKSCGEVD